MSRRLGFFTLAIALLALCLSGYQTYERHLAVPLSGCGCQPECGCKKGDCKCGDRSNAKRCGKTCKCDNGDCGCGSDACKCASQCNCLHTMQPCCNNCGCVP